MSKRITKLLICPYCKHEFGENLKELSCRHSVCESPCFVAITSSRTPRCPECNVEHVLPSNTKSIDNENEETLRRLKSLNNAYDTLPSKDSDDYDNVKEIRQTSVNTSETREELKEKVRETIKESICLINDGIKRFTDIKMKTALIIHYNRQVKENGDLKRFFHKCEQDIHDVDLYLRSIERNGDIEMDVDILLVHMWQCEEHLSILMENEFNPLIFYVKRELDKHSPNRESFATTGNHGVDVPVDGNNATFSLSADEVDGNTEAHSQGQDIKTEYEEIREETPPTEEMNCFHFANCSNDSLGMCSKISVCSITIVMTCLRVGIGIWNIVEHTSVITLIAACIMIVKTAIETCWIYWLVVCWFKRDKRTRQYICSIVILVALGVGLISDIVLVYVQEEDVNLPLLVMRIITIVDIVWTFMILLTIWLLVFRCFRH